MRLAALGGLGLALIAYGCGPATPAKSSPTPVATVVMGPSIVGTWKRTDINGKYTFDPDGKYSVEIVGKIPKTRFTGTDVVRGEYKLAAEMVTLKVQSVFSSSSDADEKMQQEIRSKNANYESKVKSMPEQVMALSFKDEDTVTFTIPGNPPIPAFTLKRQTVGN